MSPVREESAPTLPVRNSVRAGVCACGVVIVARNRAQLVEQAVRSVYALQLPAGGIELALVDSASTDTTPAVLRALAEAAPPLVEVRCLTEPSGSASRARNLGWQSLSAPIIAFLDDDAEADPGWLLAACAEFDRASRVGAVAGRTTLRWIGDPPPGELARCAEMFTALDYGEAAKRLRYPRAPIGPNMIFRREALAASGGFDPAFGPAPGRALVCEEGELCLRLEQAHWEIRYSPAAHVQHLTPAVRIDERHLLERARVHAESRFLVDWKHFGPRRALHQGGRLLRGLARGLAAFRWGIRERSDVEYARVYFKKLWENLLGNLHRRFH